MATEPQTKTAKERAPSLFDVLYGGAPVVVARSDSLQPLQALCHENDDVVPTLMTMRYRLQSGPVFGTVFATFAEDLEAVRAARRGDVRGDMLPVLEPDSIWTQFTAELRLPEPEAVHGRLTAGWVQEVLEAVAHALPHFQRVLLLCELDGDPGTLDEWQQALSILSLPRNLTIVVSAAPRGWTGPEIEPPQGAGGQEEVFTFREAALSGDQAAEVDRLGVAPLADGLARLIMLPQTRPLTVGVQAPWGWGKSSFVAFVREALIRHAPSNGNSNGLADLEELDRLLTRPVGQDETSSDAEIATLQRDHADRRRGLLDELERNARREVICVSFNAWRYEGSEQVWAGLARAITAGLERALSRTNRWRSRVAYAIWRRKLDFWLGFVAPVVLAVLIAVLAIALGVADAGDELAGWTGGLAGVLAPVAAVLLIAWRFMRVIQPVSAQVAGYVTGPDYAAHMGYQNEVIEDLRFLHQRVYDAEPRVVVVVDDLDRCSDESIMETLQAINLVLGASDFFVILAIDTDMIHRAIARQRGLSDDDETAEIFAENYLRKIIQLPLVLPGRSADQRFGFVSQLFSPSAQRDYQREEADDENDAERPPDDDGMPMFSFDPALVIPPRVQILREVQDTKEELEALHESRSLLNDNPRELKRLVNVHRLVKILLQRPDAPPTPEQQRKLVAWLVFCAASPGKVDDVLAEAAGHDDDVCIVEVGGERLSASDLAPEGTLARAARISLLVRDRPAATRPQPAAESDPAAPRAASPS